MAFDAKTPKETVVRCFVLGEATGVFRHVLWLASCVLNEPLICFDQTHNHNIIFFPDCCRDPA
jgi:hypothetical protein